MPGSPPSAASASSPGKSVIQFKATRRPALEVAKLLGIDAVISGSVLQAGDRVRVTVQLIDARVSEAILWGDSFERDSADVLGFHAEVAQVRHRCASPF